jgi:RNA polymerase sigma-70 factor, ECF subfamily
MGLLLMRRQERSFERLYQRHVADVYRYALVVLRDPEDAETITRATFVNAYRAHKRGERPRKPRNWLMGLAHDACRLRSIPPELHPPEELSEDDETPTPSDLRRALQRLDFDQRTAFVMRELDGRTNSEIAELLDFEAGDVEALVFRARKALREGLESSFTCHQAQRAVSRRLDGQLARSERKVLRAHLRSCTECERFAQAQQLHRAALRSFAFPPPRRLRIFGASIGVGPVARTAAVAAIALVIGGVIAGGVDPRRWRDDATRIQPADAANEQRPPVRQPRRLPKPPPQLAPG